MDKQRILIIDDDRDLANLFRTVLDIVGFTCEVVYSAKEGLSRLITEKPDMVLLDMRLGLEIGGQDILYQIRANPRLMDTRVIVITGYPSMVEPVADLADLILLKPIEIDQLKNLITRLSSQEITPKRNYFRDPVTGLYNQDFFYTRLEHAFERTKRRPDFQYAVLVLDVDMETPSAEQITAASIDQIASQISRRLGGKFRPTDTIARLSSTSFASLYEDLKTPQDIQIIQGRLCQALEPPFQWDDTSIQLTLKIGTACHSPVYQKPTDILQAASINQMVFRQGQYLSGDENQPGV